MATDDFINQQMRDILSRNPDATHPEIMRALAYRARLNWGRARGAGTRKKAYRRRQKSQ